MASETLKPWSYVVMALVGEGGAGAHDVVNMITSGGGRLYYAAAPSQVYAETKRLSQLGFLNARKERGQTHERTVYTLTPTGREALVGWLAQPSPWPRIQSEASIRLLAGDMLDDEAIVESLAHLRAEVDELYELLEAAERRAAAYPHRERYILLGHSLGRRMLNAHRDWLAEVEQTLLANPSEENGSRPDPDHSPAELTPATDDA